MNYKAKIKKVSFIEASEEVYSSLVINVLPEGEVREIPIGETGPIAYLCNKFGFPFIKNSYRFLELEGKECFISKDGNNYYFVSII